jgi:hypothetical protein
MPEMSFDVVDVVQLYEYVCVAEHLQPAYRCGPLRRLTAKLDRQAVSPALD